MCVAMIVARQGLNQMWCHQVPSRNQKYDSRNHEPLTFLDLNPSKSPCRLSHSTEASFSLFFHFLCLKCDLYKTHSKLPWSLVWSWSWNIALKHQVEKWHWVSHSAKKRSEISCLWSLSGCLRPSAIFIYDGLLIWTVISIFLLCFHFKHVSNLSTSENGFKYKLMLKYS